ncbi:hypothetical protein TRAPUB_3298 [Trametes pubescens]|uniref:Uncharacterized protein n=1 Tax=Trametes pubescens TaxID=154538 RepID=A0A1M2VE90_TRAPU|nr:hypothetical protein TRAPUB_3298 [Trametes pubescens]
MPFLDTLQNAALKVLPEKKQSLPMPASTTGGIGSAGVVPFEDDVSSVHIPQVTPLFPFVPRLLRTRTA